MYDGSPKQGDFSSKISGELDKRKGIIGIKAYIYSLLLSTDGVGVSQDAVFEEKRRGTGF